MKPFVAFLALLLSLSATVSAQELNFTVKINTQKLQTVDPKVFETLEASLNDFLNNQKWTNDIFEPTERIECNVLLTIQEENGPTSFGADLAIQSSRPIYGTDQKTPVFNHLDTDVNFTYEQYQPLQFSRSRYQDNLTSVLAYYVYIVLGMDYDTFSPLGGEPWFQTAQDIYNNLPSNVANGDDGWKSTSRRNRYWLVENILSPRVRPLRRALYSYHRQGLDLMHQDVVAGRNGMSEAIGDLLKTDQAYPNSMIVQTFVNAKSNEIVEIFKGASQPEQAFVIQTMTSIDPSNAQRYRSIR